MGLALALIPPGETKANVETHPILFARKIDGAHQEFSIRGIEVGPFQRDSGDNQFFAFYDLDGKKIEVCVEP